MNNARFLKVAFLLSTVLSTLPAQAGDSLSPDHERSVSHTPRRAPSPFPSFTILTEQDRREVDPRTGAEARETQAKEIEEALQQANTTPLQPQGNAPQPNSLTMTASYEVVKDGDPLESLPSAEVANQLQDKAEANYNSRPSVRVRKAATATGSAVVSGGKEFGAWMGCSTIKFLACQELACYTSTPFIDVMGAGASALLTAFAGPATGKAFYHAIYALNHGTDYVRGLAILKQLAVGRGVYEPVSPYAYTAAKFVAKKTPGFAKTAVTSVTSFCTYLRGKISKSQTESEV